MRVKFRPLSRIRRVTNGKERIVFFPGSEYEGTLNINNTVSANSNKADRVFILRENEINITMYNVTVPKISTQYRVFK